MIDQRVLAAATQRNILTQEQAERIAELARELGADEGEPFEREPLRLVTGFSDLFVTIGILLFLSTIFYFATRWVAPYAAFALVTCLAWLLAEVFTLRRHQPQSSIVLLVIFAFSVFSASTWMLDALYGEGSRPTSWRLLSSFAFLVGDTSSNGSTLSPVIAVSAAITVLGVMVHYLRFRVPITIAVGAGSLAASVLALLSWGFPNLVAGQFRWLFLATGLAIFLLAMRFDLSDPARVTRRAEIAFWLHLVAAPLIVHPLISSFVATGGGTLFTSAVHVIVSALLISAVSLVIDRRAILVSSLVYLGFAVGSLTAGAVGVVAALPLALLVLGSYILVLSAGWVPLRKALMRLLPERLVLRLPRPVG